MRSSGAIEDRAHIQVLNAVRRALVESPELENRELYDRAVARYEWVKELSPQQFYGRFVRRARREVGVKPRSRAATEKPTPRKEPEATKPAEEKPARKARRTSRPSVRPAPKPSVAARPEVRRLFIEFAEEVAAAGSDSELIEVLRRVDSYADRVLSAHHGRSDESAPPISAP